MATGDIPARSESELITRQGERRVIAWNNTVLRGAGGLISGTASIGEDITERKEVEARMDLQLSALEATANTILITSRNGVIEWVNPAFTTLTGYSYTEAIGNNPSMLKSDKHDGTFFFNMWDVICSGKVWQGEVINKRKDGAFIPRR